MAKDSHQKMSTKNEHKKWQPVQICYSLKQQGIVSINLPPNTGFCDWLS